MRRLAPLFLLATIAGLLLAPARLAADLVWTPEGGWQVEGGVAAGMGGGPGGRNALDIMNRARAQEEAGDLGKALDDYTTVYKKFPNSVYAGEALYRAGSIYQKREQFYKSFDTYQMMLARYPSSEKFTQVVGEQYRIAALLMEGKRSKIWGLFPGFRNREKALEYFEIIVATAPFSDYAPLALMNAARGYKMINETPAAIDALDRMINTYPASVLTPDAYLKLAQTHASLVDGPYYDQASTKLAITYYEDYMILFPGDAGMATAEKGLAEMKTVLAQSKLTLGDYYTKYRRNYRGAKVFYNEAITVYPDSAVATEARARLAEMDAMLEITPAGGTAAPPPAAPKKKRFWLF
jgi:outer membrane protein assembly factor BamD